VTRTFLIVALSLLPLSAGPQRGWADRPADLTLGEFLDLWFKTQMARRESDALNSYSLVSFTPSTNPDEALVVVIQTWRDERLSESDLRRAIRKAADVELDLFRALLEHPRLKKRWAPSDPESNLVVRHVRFSDLRETLGVTRKGKTEFEPEAMLEAKKAVEGAGGIWSW
jgi:hypothetical protein